MTHKPNTHNNRQDLCVQQCSPAVTTNTKYKSLIQRRLGSLTEIVGRALDAKCKVSNSLIVSKNILVLVFKTFICEHL